MVLVAQKNSFAYMEIKLIEIGGFASALKALRLPYGKEARSEMVSTTFAHGNFIGYDSKISINDKDLSLMSALVKRGDEHAKVMRGIVVWAEITAPVYMWAEIETYRAGHERLSSQSTMHIDCKGLKGEELQKAKSEIPMGKELKKIDFFSYQCLRNIYFQRRNHRLPEWHQFCEWIEGLPYAKELIICENGQQDS